MTTYIYEDNLISDRLITRKLTKDDTAILIDFFKDKETVEFLPTWGLTSTQKLAECWIDRQLSRYAENRFGLQALIDKKTGDFIGMCGLLTQEVDGKKEIEVSYHLFRKYWGQGFASEAARLFIDYAFKNNLADSVISIIDKKNYKSIRVAEKNGLVPEKESVWSGIEVCIYRLRHSNNKKKVLIP